MTRLAAPGLVATAAVAAALAGCTGTASEPVTYVARYSVEASSYPVQVRFGIEVDGAMDLNDSEPGQAWDGISEFPTPPGGPAKALLFVTAIDDVESVNLSVSIDDTDARCEIETDLQAGEQTSCQATIGVER
ncbi:hypothetical protein ACFFGH_10705 [Lysobacter korlensis]|uniref:Lipoprotein n=1 Tax=Lysobacter korlensis TaxID=553636 RepID=A0ABV6RMV2_9GAMM